VPEIKVPESCRQPQLGDHLDAATISVYSQARFSIDQSAVKIGFGIRLEKAAGGVERRVSWDIRVCTESQARKSAPTHLGLGRLDQSPAQAVPRVIRQDRELFEVCAATRHQDVNEADGVSVGCFADDEDEAGRLVP
jgi:hypothetical protein